MASEDDDRARVAIPTSLQGELQATLESSLEYEDDDDRVVMKSGAKWSNEPKGAAQRIVRALLELPLSSAAQKRFQESKPALSELLQKTPLDDLDGVTLLDRWIELARLAFHDDFMSVPVEERASLERGVRDAIDRGVSDAVGVAELVARVADAARSWSKAHDVPTRGLATWERDTWFGGVAFYDEVEARAALAEKWSTELTRMLKIRWRPSARGAAPYARDGVYEVGDTVLHPTFGRGTVARKLDGKVEILFPAGARLLAAKQG